MKKALLCLLAGAGLTAATAQTTIMTEDFSNDAPGWVIENLGAPTGAWDYRAINPGFLTTGDNGTLFAYGYNYTAGATHNGNTQITSIAFDCSNSSSVFLQWEQIFDVIQQNSTCTIEVSADSTNWTEVYRNTAPVGPELGFADLTAVAGNKATVYLRFKFRSTGDYYWIVDDVKMFAPKKIGIEALDAEIVAMSSGSPAVTYTTNQGMYGYEMEVRNLGADANFCRG